MYLLKYLNITSSNCPGQYSAWRVQPGQCVIRWKQSGWVIRHTQQTSRLYMRMVFHPCDEMFPFSLLHFTLARHLLYSFVISSIPVHFLKRSPGRAGRCLVCSGSDTSAINTHTELLSGTGTLWLTCQKVQILDKAASTALHLASTRWAKQWDSQLCSHLLSVFSFHCQLMCKWVFFSAKFCHFCLNCWLNKDLETWLLCKKNMIKERRWRKKMKLAFAVTKDTAPGLTIVTVGFHSRKRTASSQEKRYNQM